MDMLIGFGLGIYFTLVVCSFIVIMFGVMLGGKSEDLWKPFVYSLFCPIVFPLWFFGYIEI